MFLYSWVNHMQICLDHNFAKPTCSWNTSIVLNKQIIHFNQEIIIIQLYLLVFTTTTIALQQQMVLKTAYIFLLQNKSLFPLSIMV